MVLANVLIGIPVKNCAQYLPQTINQILALTYPKEKITIVFLEGDSADNSWKLLNETIRPRLGKEGYRAIYMIHLDFGFKLPHCSRHLAEIQNDRGRVLGEVRATIINGYLADNQYVCWFDADLEKIPRDYIESMIMRSVVFDADIIAPVVITRDGKCYVLGTNSMVDGKKLNSVELAKHFPIKELIEVASCEPWFIHRPVLDSGVNTHNIKKGLELIVFSERAKEKGFKSFLASRIVVVHQSINGMQKLEVR